MDGIVLRDARRGGRISAQERNDLARAARAGRLIAGPGIRLTRTPSGTTVSAVPSRAPGGRASASDVDAGSLRSPHYGAGTYIVEAARANYITDFAETSLVTLLPAGARVVVHPALCRVAAGN